MWRKWYNILGLCMIPIVLGTTKIAILYNSFAWVILALMADACMFLCVFKGVQEFYKKRKEEG